MLMKHSYLKPNHLILSLLLTFGVVSTGYAASNEATYGNGNREPDEFLVSGCKEHGSHAPGFTSWIETENSKTLDFYIKEISIPGWPLATCVCPYTIDATYQSYYPGEYTLRFHQGGEIYTVTADLSEGFEACYTAAQLVSTMVIEANGKPIRKLNEDVLRFEAPGEFNAELIDANGIILLNISATDSAEISIAGLKGGIYIARMIKRNGETETLRFMK